MVGCLSKKFNHTATLNGDLISYKRVPTDPFAVLSHVECMNMTIVPHQSRIESMSLILLAVEYTVHSFVEFADRIFA